MIKHLPVVVVSDIHLGTFGCHAAELLTYLQSVDPEILILNGDIIDAWQFKKRYFPAKHNEVIKEILRKSLNGTKVYYITGNHDDVLRRFSDFSMGNMHLVDKLVLQMGNKKYWFFHGDIFDASMKISPLLAKMGGKGYDYLIRINRLINNTREYFGKEPMSFSKRIKTSVKKAIKYIDDFEMTAINLAIENKFDYVVCGHIHQPQLREVKTDKGSVHYMNSGDWVESLTALEFDGMNWRIYHHLDAVRAQNQRNKTKNNGEKNIAEAF